MEQNKIGKYEIIGELGRGAMGVVYKATDPYIGRTVAIKTIRFDVIGQRSEMEEAQRRFMREARSAGNLSHPNIVTIYDVGEDAGLTYIAMEFIEGSSLEDFIASGQSMALDQKIELICQVADALESAHRKGVVHRDIKPGNILVDREGRPHIVDFGIARISTSTMTQTNMIMGTPYYMSPEQICGKKVDNRSDIFALGAVFYELLTLQKPFPGDNVTTVMYKIMNEAPIPARTFQQDLPEGLDYVIQKALAKDPGQRYQSCLELIADLRNYGRYAGMAGPEEKKAAASKTALAGPAYAPPAEVIQEQVAGEAVVEERRRKPLLIILASMMALIVVSAIIIFILARGPKPSGGSGGGPVPPASFSAEKIVAEGNSSWKEKKYSEAIARFRDVLAQEPAHYEAQLSIARILEEQGSWDQAITEYEKLVALNSADPRPYLYLGGLYEQKRAPDRALENLKKFVGLSPQGPDRDRANQKIAELESQILASKEQELPLKKPIEVKPDVSKPEAGDKEIPSGGEKQEKVEPTPRVEKVEPEKRSGVLAQEIQGYLEIAKGAFQKGNYQECIKQANKVLSLDPGNSEAQSYLTRAQKIVSGRSQQQELQGYLEITRGAFEKGNYAEAIKQAKNVLKFDPANSEARRILNSAGIKISPVEIKALVDEYVLSLKNESSVDFYRRRCSPALFNRIRKDTELVFELYDDLRASASNVTINFKETRYESAQADISFTHILTGVARETGTRQVIFEGIYQWSLGRRGDSWTITDIVYNTKDRK